MDDRLYGFLGAVLVLLAIMLPMAGAVWFVQKRGKSARAAALFLVPYYSLPIVLLLWATGVNGIRLLAGGVGVVAVVTLLCYGSLGRIDYYLSWNKQYPEGFREYQDEVRRRKEDED
jgi:hypothetical protein